MKKILAFAVLVFVTGCATVKDKPMLLMPPATKESPVVLLAQGLTEKKPGVWDRVYVEQKKVPTTPIGNIPLYEGGVKESHLKICPHGKTVLVKKGWKLGDEDPCLMKNILM